MFQKCVSKSESRQPLDKNDDDVTDSSATHTAHSEHPPNQIYPPQPHTGHTRQILRQIYKIIRCPVLLQITLNSGTSKTIIIEMYRKIGE